ncbi:MAG TPA: hypothetical protein VI296_01035, partial [Candidatus Dormibacteraeota bacterium]
GATRTDELAVMWDTFRPLRLTTLWRDHDDPDYAYSWNPDRLAGGSADGDQRLGEGREAGAAAAAADADNPVTDAASTVTGPSA